MAIRFNRRIRIAPGIRLNVGRSRTSVTLGKPGASLNLGQDGVRAMTGVPGTGLGASHQVHRSSRNTPNDTTSGASIWKVLSILGLAAALLAAFMRRR